MYIVIFTKVNIETKALPKTGQGSRCTYNEVTKHVASDISGTWEYNNRCGRTMVRSVVGSFVVIHSTYRLYETSLSAANEEVSVPRRSERFLDILIPSNPATEIYFGSVSQTHLICFNNVC